MNDPIEGTLARWRRGIDAELARVATSHEELSVRLREAIHYSLTGEGKRLRGMLLMAAFDAVRAESSGSDQSRVLAAALEIVHAYSLVHDDLPCMDDDNVRRGRPTTHRAFDVSTATLAGVTMVPLAVEQTIRGARSLGLDDSVTKRLVAILMKASGAAGMVGGQLRDLEGEGEGLSVGELESIHRAKTGALISASVVMGGIAAGGTAAQLDGLAAAGAALGLAFQIADDVLDATQSSAVLGKTAGKDVAVAKSTYASAMGITAASRRTDALVEEAMTRLDAAGLRTPVLGRLAHFVAARRS